MGSSKSRVASVLSEDIVEENSSCPAESKGTSSCWTGIRKFFSRNSKVVPLASESDADGDADEDSDDHDDLVQTSNTAQGATVVASAVASVAVAGPAELHRPTSKGVLSDLIGQKDQPIISRGVQSSPVIGQKCEQPSVPAERRSRARYRVRSDRASTSYRAEVRVSSARFLHYHRFVNDEDIKPSDEESSTEDDYVADADIDSDVDEIAGKCIAHKFSKRAIKVKRSVHKRKGPKGLKGSKKPCDESSDNETRPVTRRPRSRRVEKVRSTTDDVTKKTVEGTINNLPCGPMSDNVTRAEEIKSSRDEGRDITEKDFFLFMISLSYIAHVRVGLCFPGCFAVIAERVENETDDDEDDDETDDDDDDDDEEEEKKKKEKEEKKEEEEEEKEEKKGKKKQKTKNKEEEEEEEQEEQEEQEDDEYEPDWVSESETDIDQPSTSYKRDKRATYDFIVQSVLKTLVACKVPIEDALLHAIESRDVGIVMEIIDLADQEFKHEYITVSRGSDLVNRFAVTSNFPSFTTPLLLASKLDDWKIVELLLDNGATMPTEEETLARINDDSLERALARLQWYQSMTSDAYILLTSDDPIETALSWGEQLKVRASHERPVFSSCYDVIHSRLEMLLTRLLDCATCKDEIWEALNERAASDGMRRSVSKRGVLSDPMGRLKRVVRLEYKMFVSHSYCQEYILRWWYSNGPIPWVSCSQIVRIFLVLLIAVLSPIICAFDIILPENIRCVRWFDRLMATPFIQHILHTCSYIAFLHTLLYMTMGIYITPVECPSFVTFRHNPTGFHCVRYTYTLFPLGSRFCVVLLWVIGMTWQHVTLVYAQGLKTYLRVYWHIVDFTSIALHWAYIALNISISRTGADTIVYNNGTQTAAMHSFFNLGKTFHFHFDKYEVTRRGWDTFDPQLIADICFSVANILSCLRLLHATVAFQFVGPLQISFGAILKDMGRFACLMVFVLIAFGLGFTQLYATYNTENDAECKMDPTSEACSGTSFETITKSMASLFWAIHGETSVQTLSLSSNLWFTEIVGKLLFGVYMVLVVTIMLNALIAMLSNTYSRVEENARKEWHFARTRMMLEYDQMTGFLPPPFNIVPRVGWWVQKAYKGLRRITVYVWRCQSSDVILIKMEKKDHVRSNAPKARIGHICKKSGGKILANRLLQCMQSNPERSQQLVYY